MLQYPVEADPAGPGRAPKGKLVRQTAKAPVARPGLQTPHGSGHGARAGWQLMFSSSLRGNDRVGGSFSLPCSFQNENSHWNANAAYPTKSQKKILEGKNVKMITPVISGRMRNFLLYTFFVFSGCSAMDEFNFKAIQYCLIKQK